MSATFTQLGHQYEVDGVLVPSVTQVLTLSGISDVSMVPAYNLEKARQIGEAVHSACEFLDKDDLDLDSLDPLIVGYVVGYQKFREEYEFKPRLIEHRIVAEAVGLPYGMCVDRVGMLNSSELEALVDIKTASNANASWAIQTAAYGEGLKSSGPRLIVHVAKDGTYKLIPCAVTDEEDENQRDIWHAALKVAHYRLQNGAKLK